MKGKVSSWWSRRSVRVPVAFPKAMLMLPAPASEPNVAVLVANAPPR